MSERIPVILDTDIGSDIDDTWALVMLLNSPELDLKLITVVGGNSTYRTKLVAKLLSLANRTDIPIAYNQTLSGHVGLQADWVADYSLEEYPGVLYTETARPMAQTVAASSSPVKIIAIGSCNNLAQAFTQYPEIVKNAEFVGMQGSIYRGYGGSNQPSWEANVKSNVQACTTTFNAPFLKKSITPLDTCGTIKLTGSRYQRVLESKNPLTQAIIENYQHWWKHCTWNKQSQDLSKESSTLFDTVAVYLAFCEEMVEIEELPLIVTDDGYTRIDPAGSLVRCAVNWKHVEAFYDLLVERVSP